MILNSMLLVQVMAYVMSGTFAVDIVGRWTCTLESGPLIGSPVATILPVGEIFADRQFDLSSRQEQTCL